MTSQAGPFEADQPPLAAARVPGTALLPVQGRVSPLQFGGEPGEPASAETQTSGGLSGYYHALRRNWPWATALGLLCAAVAGAGMWFYSVPKYTAVSLLQISANQDQIIPTADQASRTTFDVYKGTQQQLLTSDLVFVAALRKPEVAKLEILQREEDPVRWIGKSLRVDFPGNAEILRVSLTSTSADDAAAIVAAVVDAYLNEVVDKEAKLRGGRLEALEKLYGEKETEMRDKRSNLKQLAESLGSGDTGALALKQQMAMQEYAETRNDVARLNVELQRARGELLGRQAALEAKKKKEITQSELDAFAISDPSVAKLKEELDNLKDQLKDAQNLVKGPLAKNQEAVYATAMKRIEGRLATRRKDLIDRIKVLRAAEQEGIEAEIKQKESNVAVMTEQLKLAAKDLEARKKLAERFGNSSIDVEMMRSELQYLEKTVAAVAEERERLKVELRSGPRITLRQPAAAPRSPDNVSRLQNTLVAGMFGFFLPAGLLTWWDVRGRRINSIGDVSRGLGLTVVGTVPQMPPRVLRPSRKRSRRHQLLATCLEQSVDGIAARMFLRKTGGRARMVLVSSATRGEGKSTLATMLAQRLARTGARTLLIDFDLRRPALHRAFGAKREPGVSDLLKSDGDLTQAVQPTEIQNLSLLAAGSPMQDSLGTLANGVTRGLFEKARAAYEFVIVDGSPILPVVDARLASQHVDAVILSVRRDVSQGPKVLAACELLNAFGVQKFVAVLSGSNEDSYYYDSEHIVEARVEDVATP